MVLYARRTTTGDRSGKAVGSFAGTSILAMSSSRALALIASATSSLALQLALEPGAGPAEHGPLVPVVLRGDGQRVPQVADAVLHSSDRSGRQVRLGCLDQLRIGSLGEDTRARSPSPDE